ncbi:MAG: hypothetical protein KC729_15050 [Candidatus Eisenbacteria bacterium]|uniref:FlgD/Vpr Ig-like domain-containing protein n=1 Tax=Eiseniibacteriota bacterium TaxID=2212470 RepID=A0A956M115_UNCEI|nr:hypothetical protein [Candidatus Eisenbacteria bacterium]
MRSGTSALYSCIALGAVLAISTASVETVRAAVLYDVTFDLPHQVGLPAVEDSGPAPRHVLSPDAGDAPIVVDGVGALVDQPVRMDYNTDGSNPDDKVLLRLHDLGGAEYPLPLAEFYSISMDLLVDGGDGDAGISVFVDAPAVRRLDFQIDGTAGGFVSGEGSFVLPSFTVGDVLHLRLDVDLDADTWQVFYDDAEVYSGPFGSASIIETVRVSTTFQIIGGSVEGGVDNLLVVIPDDGPCDRVTFNDLTLHDSWIEGQSFVSSEVRVDVSEFYDTVGPCGGSSVSGFAEVVGTHLACGGGKEIQVSNVTLDFDFHGPVTDVLIRYGEYGGTVSLGVNGDCQVVDRMVDLDGTNMGGVAVTVFDEQPNAQGCGVIRLGGEVTQLSIGGQEFFVDQISYCPACGELRRSAYEDQTLGTQYFVSDVFTSGSATHTMRRFSPPGADCSVLTAGGVATIGNGDASCQASKEIQLNNIMDDIDFGEQITWLALAYGEYGGNVNLRINGECRNSDNLSDFNGDLIGGVYVWAVDYGTPGQSCGTLYAVGNITEFAIGGQEFFIDNIRTCLDATAGVEQGEAGDDAEALPVPSGILRLSPNEPNPFGPGTAIRFDLAAPAAATISIHDVGGRLIRSLGTQRYQAGAQSVWWDGRDSHGRDVAAGSYLCRVSAGDALLTRRMVKLPQ